MQKIEEDTFKELLNLKELHLWNNEIRALEKKTFNGLNNLEILFLNENSITLIDNGVFASLVELRELYLQSNNFDFNLIGFEMFNTMTKLQILYLDN